MKIAGRLIGGLFIGGWIWLAVLSSGNAPAQTVRPSSSRSGSGQAARKNQVDPPPRMILAQYDESQPETPTPNRRVPRNGARNGASGTQSAPTMRSITRKEAEDVFAEGDEATLGPVEEIPNGAQSGPRRFPAQPDQVYVPGASLSGCGPNGAGCDRCGGDCNGDCAGGGDCEMSCGPCGPGCHGHFGRWVENLTLSLGAEGFKGPADNGRNGNFGLNEEITWGGPVWRELGVGYQLGARWVQSDLSGHQATGTVQRDERNQVFLTTGLFHRPPCGQGLQGGIVWDYLHDAYYVNMNLSQIRGELSWIGFRQNEVGFWFAGSTDSDTKTFNANHSIVTWEPTDLFAFFYRKHFNTGSEGRAWAGFTGKGDGLLGGDFSVPLSDRLALQAEVNYLIPKQAPGAIGMVEESWGLACNLVWYPGRSARCADMSVFRPLFRTASNSTLMVDSHTGNAP
jgi:hypothetical protein